MTVKNDKKVVCSYKNYACREAFCPFNVLHKTYESFSAFSDIPTESCLSILDMIADERFDRSLRVWMEAIFVKKDDMVFPREFAEAMERQAAEYRMRTIKDV